MKPEEAGTPEREATDCKRTLATSSSQTPHRFPGKPLNRFAFIPHVRNNVCSNPRLSKMFRRAYLRMLRSRLVRSLNSLCRSDDWITKIERTTPQCGGKIAPELIVEKTRIQCMPKTWKIVFVASEAGVDTASRPLSIASSTNAFTHKRSAFAEHTAVWEGKHIQLVDVIRKPLNKLCRT